METQLTVIIVNYNSSHHLKKCLESFKSRLKKVSSEIVVVDSGSNISDYKQARSFSGNFNVKFIRSKNNLGFGCANNIGLRYAKGEFILFLNPDTLAGDIDFKEILGWMAAKPDIGAMSVKLKNINGTIQGNGGYFPTLIRVFSWMFFIDDIPFIDRFIKSFHPQHPRFFPNNKFYDTIKELDWVTGAFFLARSEVLGSGFDEKIFMYGEDVDLSKKIKDQGFKIFYNPTWYIYHLGGGSSNAIYPIVTEFESLKYYFKKYMPKYETAFLRLILKAGVLIRMILFTLIGKKDLANAYEKTFTKI